MGEFEQRQAEREARRRQRAKADNDGISSLLKDNWKPVIVGFVVVIGLFFIINGVLSENHQSNDANDGQHSIQNNSFNIVDVFGRQDVDPSLLTATSDPRAIISVIRRENEWIFTLPNESGLYEVSVDDDQLICSFGAPSSTIYSAVDSDGNEYYVAYITDGMGMQMSEMIPANNNGN